MTVTCLRSPSILSRWERIFSVRPLGRYRWILLSFSSKERSLGEGETGCDRYCPHSLQNLLPGGLVLPHSGQAISNLAPHSLQNLAPLSFSLWHFGHFISDAL